MFELGRYELAKQYLQAAVVADPHDAQSADRLKTTELVLRMDPFRSQVSSAQRNRVVMEDFAIAGQRLKSCPSVDAFESSTNGQPSLIERWDKMKPHITGRGLRHDPDLVEAAMELVFRIQRKASAACGPAAATDTALLLIGKLHEEN